MKGLIPVYPAKDGCFSANRSVKGQEVRKVREGERRTFSLRLEMEEPFDL